MFSFKKNDFVYADDCKYRCTKKHEIPTLKSYYPQK